MASESDRIARAGDYVLGLMNDKERERAERDLEIDPAFRDAVVRLAERMHVFDRAEKPAGSQSLGAGHAAHRRIAADAQCWAGGNDTNAGDPRPVAPAYGVGVHSLGGRRGFVVAIVLIAVFALGYLVGRL